MGMVSSFRAWCEKRKAMREIALIDHDVLMHDAARLKKYLADVRGALTNGATEAAARMCGAARARFPGLFETTPEALELLVEVGQPDEAERLLSRALTIKPRDSELWAASAKLAEERGNDAGAAACWRKARRLNSSNRDLFFNEAACWRRLGRFADEDAVLRRATVVHSHFEWSHEAYAHAALARRNWKEAHRRWSKARTYAPLSGMVGMAGCLDAMGRHEEAEKWLMKAAQDFPTRPAPLIELGWTAHRRGDWALAARRWEHLRNMFPAAKEGYIAGAQALYETGDYAAADKILATGIERQPRNQDILIAYARIAHQQKRWNDAVARWDRMRTLFPEHTEANSAFEEAVLALGRADDLNR